MPPEDLLRLTERQNFQSSGPGGQKRNRVRSAVRLKLPALELISECGEFREADRNLKKALRGLRLKLALAAAENVETESREEYDFAPARRPAFRVRVNPEHDDFPEFAFRALGALRYFRGDQKAAAAVLEVSPSALVRFLKIDKRVFARANDCRTRLGLPPLH